MAKTGKTNLLSEEEESKIEANRRLKAKSVKQQLQARKAAIKNRPAEPGAKLTTRKPQKPNRRFVHGAVVRSRRKTAA